MERVDLTKLARRYGPVGGIVAAIVLIVLLVPSGSGPARVGALRNDAGVGFQAQADSTTTAAPDAASTNGAQAASVTRTTAGTARSTKPGGSSATSNIVHSSPVAACGKGGRLDIGFSYAPPCAATFSGDNHGSTWAGVTGNKIRIAYYLNSTYDPETAATVLAGGGCATDACTWDFAQTYVRWFAKRYQLYGRQIELVKLQASGTINDDSAAHADAKWAKDNNIFAVMNGPTTTAFARDLKAYGILCFCTTSLPQPFYEEMGGFVWGVLPSSTQAYIHRAEFVGKRLNGKKAKWAGDPLFQQQNRVFGFVWYDTPQGDYKLGADFFLKTLKDTYGIDIPPDRVARYAGQTLADAQVYAPQIIAQMQSKGVTSLIFSGDPVQPIALTNSAKNSTYNPEWIVTGSALTDTDTFGRLYQQDEWTHAFGLSLLAVPVPNPKTWWYKAYRAEQDMAAAAPDSSWSRTDPAWPTIDASVVAPFFTNFFTGVHMAGPVLNPTTFQAGMFAYPATGGTVTVPRMSFGPKDVGGYKFVDYTAYDDTMEIWWDPTQPASACADAKAGCYARVDAGKRYAFGAWPSTDPKAFVRNAGEIYKVDNPPDQ